MEDKTSIELLHTLSELKTLYTEYKDTTGHVKYFMEKHFDSFALQKDATPDSQFFKFCDETKQMRVHTDVSLLEENIDGKIKTLEIGLQTLKIMDPVQAIESQSMLMSQSRHKFKRTKDMDMPTLKRERERLLKLQERHEKQITFLVNELKQTKHKFESMAATLAQERSQLKYTKEELQRANCKNENVTRKVDELQIVLKEVKKEKKHLEDKYHKEKFKHKHTREGLDHANCQNNGMTKKVEELQFQISTYMKTTAKMEQHTKELQVQLEQALTEHKCLEDKYQDDMSDYSRKSKDFDRDIKELQVQLTQALEENKHLEEKYHDKLSEEEKTRDELHQNIKELQLRLKQVEKEKQFVEETCKNEKDTYKLTQEKCELAIYKLQKQVRQAEEENKCAEKEYQDEMYVLQNRRKELEQLVGELRLQLKLLEEENKYAREKYEIEMSKHKNTREELNQDITELQVQFNLAEEEKTCLEEKHRNEMLTRKELTRVVEELKHQLKQVERDNKCVEQKYQHAFSKHRGMCEELDKVRSEKNILIEKLEELERQKENEMENKDLQIQQLQTIGKKLTKDLRTQEHVEAGNTRRIENLKINLQACGVFMRYLLDTRDKLEDNLSDKDKFYQEREKRYVKLINMHIQKQHEARKKLEETRPWPQRLSCWLNKRDQRDDTNMTSWGDEETRYYPDDWRLPKEEETCIETSKCNKKDYKLFFILLQNKGLWSGEERVIQNVLLSTGFTGLKILNLFLNPFVKEHQLKKTFEKASEPIPQKVSCWWHKKVLKRNTFGSSKEVVTSLYPEDW